MSTTEWIAVGTFIYTVLGSIVGLTWGISQVKTRVESSLRKEMDQRRVVVDNELRALRLAVTELNTTVLQGVGELGHALRAKITDVEFFVRDNYVREKDLDAIMKMIEGRFDRLQVGMDRVVERLDQKD